MTDPSRMPEHDARTDPAAAWPRFAEIPEPQVACLHVGRASGSKAFQSFLDGHPQIYMIPAYPLVYLYPHWERWQRELGDAITWEAIVDAFCLQHGSVIDPNRIPGHDGMTKLGESKDESVELDEGTFRAFLLHVLEGMPIRSRTFVIAVHYAYAFCRGEDLAQKRVLVFHVHVQAFAQRYFVPDFPEGKVIGAVRDQRSNLRGRFAHSTLAVHDAKLNRTDAILFRRRSYYEVCNLLYNGSATVKAGHGKEAQRVVRLEDLHYRLEDVMRASAEFLGIRFDPCLMDSTFGGLPFWGDAIYNMEPMNKVNPRVVSKDWQKTLKPLDWFIVEGLFYDYLTAYGYPLYKYTQDNWLNRAKLFILMLLPTEMERQLVAAYFRPSNIRDFAHACADEASGTVPLKDYSFNAYYRHRWGLEDMNLWKPRWYRKLAGSNAGIVSRTIYKLVNLSRYGYAALACPLWIIKRWRLSFDAYLRLIRKNDYLPPMLPQGAVPDEK